MMMAHPQQPPHQSHSDPRHYYSQSFTQPQWVPASRDRFARTSSFYAAASNEPFSPSSLPPQSSAGYFQEMPAGTSSPVSAHVAPARSALPMSRTLSHDAAAWSPVGEEWSGRGGKLGLWANPTSAQLNIRNLDAAAHATSGAAPPATLSRTLSLSSHHQAYETPYSFTHDSGQVSAWDDSGERKARHLDPTWTSGAAHSAEYPLEERQWPAYGSDTSGQEDHYSSMPHVRGAPFNTAATTYGGLPAQLGALSSPGRDGRRASFSPVSPSSGWQNAMSGSDSAAGTAAFGTAPTLTPSPVLSSSMPKGAMSPHSGHVGSSPTGSLLHASHHPLAPPSGPVQVKEEADLADVPPKKKRRRASGRQLETLNSVYARTAFPTTEERHELARQLEMTPRSVQIWFQNRRQTQRERRPMGASPLAPNVERVSSRRESHSIRGVGSSRNLPTSLASMSSSSTSMIPLSAPGGSNSAASFNDDRDARLPTIIEPVLPSAADDTQHTARTRGRAKRAPGQ